MISCPKCNSISTIKNGYGHDKVQHYVCKECKTDFVPVILNGARVLILDIETAPIRAMVWRVWKENISIEQIKADWFILCWSAKWLNSPEVMGERLSGKEALKEDDGRIVKKLWLLFDEADLIIAHNGWSFDIPKVNSRFILNKLNPPSPYRSIDTLKIAQKKFGFTHNKLDYLAKLFGLDRKLKTDFELWVKCLEGKDESLQYMLDYNKLDVVILEEVYLKLRGWANSHPNMNMWQSESGCSNCGSLRLTPKGHYYTQTGKYKSFQCQDCGAFSRETRKTNISIAR